MLNPNVSVTMADNSPFYFKTSYVKSKLHYYIRYHHSVNISKHHMLNPNDTTYFALPGESCISKHHMLNPNLCGSHSAILCNFYFKTSYVKSKPIVLRQDTVDFRISKHHMLNPNFISVETELFDVSFQNIIC